MPCRGFCEIGCGRKCCRWLRGFGRGRSRRLGRLGAGAAGEMDRAMDLFAARMAGVLLRSEDGTADGAGLAKSAAAAAGAGDAYPAANRDTALGGRRRSRILKRLTEATRSSLRGKVACVLRWAQG